MTPIKLTFIIDLRDYNQNAFNQYYGPAFHRFLPNNKFDKLQKNLNIFDGQISFWFEKRGVIEDDLLVYNKKEKIVNDEIILKQGILDAGPLYGEVLINKLSNRIIQVLKKNKTGDPEYLSFAKKIIKEITENSSLLINIFH